MAERLPMEMGKLFSSNPKRKFRWAIQVFGDDTTQHYVRTFSRPEMSFDEHEINFRHEKMWVAGKMTWSEISMTILDVEKVNPMYEWVRSVYELQASGSEGSAGFALMGYDYGTDSYKKEVNLYLLDAKGNKVEDWLLKGCWPKTVSFGDLDYSSSDALDIEVTLRFDRAELRPTNVSGIVTGSA